MDDPDWPRSGSLKRLSTIFPPEAEEEGGSTSPVSILTVSLGNKLSPLMSFSARVLGDTSAVKDGPFDGDAVEKDEVEKQRRREKRKLYLEREAGAIVTT